MKREENQWYKILFQALHSGHSARRQTKLEYADKQSVCIWKVPAERVMSI